MLNWGFQQKIVGSRSISEAKNLVIFCRCLVEFAGIASCFFFVVHNVQTALKLFSFNRLR